MFSKFFPSSNGCGLAAAVAVAGVALGAATASASLISNGDFSANAAAYQTSPGGSISPNPSAPTDWAISGQETSSNGHYQSYVAVNGPDTYAGSSGYEVFAPFSNLYGPTNGNNTLGVQDFVALAAIGSPYPPPTATQTVTTSAGQLYQLSYAAAQRANNTSAVLDVTITDAVTSTVIATQTPAIGDGSFSAFSLDFTATSAQTAIAFSNPAVGVISDVSDVVLSSVPSVPDPATLGLVGVGAIGLLLLKRRRTV